MTGSNDSLKFDVEYNFIRLELSEFYLVQKYHFINIENGNFAIFEPIIFHKPLHGMAI